MKLRVYYEDTDAGGIVYHTNYIKFCERARSEMFFNSKLKPFSDECYFVVTNLEAKFIKPARLGDLLNVTTRVLEIKRASVVLKQEVWRLQNLEKTSTNELLFSANFTVAAMSYSKPCRLSDELVSFFSSNFSKE